MSKWDNYRVFPKGRRLRDRLEVDCRSLRPRCGCRIDSQPRGVGRQERKAGRPVPITWNVPAHNTAAVISRINDLRSHQDIPKPVPGRKKIFERRTALCFPEMITQQEPPPRGQGLPYHRGPCFSRSTARFRPICNPLFPSLDHKV